MLGDITAADELYIITGYTDMRKSIDGLCAIVEKQLQIRHANEICRIRRNFHRIPVTLPHLNPPQILPENPR